MYKGYNTLETLTVNTEGGSGEGLSIIQHNNNKHVLAYLEDILVYTRYLDKWEREGGPIYLISSHYRKPILSGIRGFTRGPNVSPALE